MKPFSSRKRFFIFTKNKNYALIRYYLNNIKMERKSLWQRSRDNLIATIIYGLITFALTILYEKVIIGLTWLDWLGARGIYIFLRYALLFLLDYLIDYFRSLMPKILADAIALSCYQIPLYCLAAIIMQVPSRSIALTALIYLADNLCFAWLYGYILDKTRKFFQ